jgi:hypothetical protein
VHSVLHSHVQCKRQRLLVDLSRMYVCLTLRLSSGRRTLLTFPCLGTKSKRNNVPADVIDIPEPRSYGMGFDDGPNCSHNAFYEFLRENNQTATMFYIGSNVMDWPLQAQDAIADGHQISIHTWSHNYMTALTNEQAFAELYYTRKAIKLVTGVTPLSW